MDESREAAAEGKATGLLTLAEVPSWVTHDAANDRHQVMCCLGFGSQYNKYCIDCIRHGFPAATQPQ